MSLEYRELHPPAHSFSSSHMRSILRCHTRIVVPPSVGGAPVAINAILGRVSTRPAAVSVDRGAADFHPPVVVGTPVDARPIGGGQEGASREFPAYSSLRLAPHQEHIEIDL